MSHMHKGSTATSVGVPGQEIASIVSRIMKRWKIYYNTRKAVEALSALSDHQLKDIGLTRDQIPHVAERTSVINAF